MRPWLAILALLLAGCTAPEERAAVHVERGKTELAEGETAAALLEFQSALALRPGDAALYTQIGDVLYENSQAYEESLLYYQEARRIDPDNVHAKMREVRLIAFQNPERARELVDSELIYKAGVNPEVLLADAYLALLKGDLDHALISAREAVLIDETAPPGWSQLGQVYLAKIGARKRRGQDPGLILYGLALGAFNKVEELKGGEYPRARLETARVYWFQGLRKRARIQFIDAVDLAVSQGDKSEALFAIETALGYARRVDDQDLVRRMLRHRVELTPTNYAAWDALAQAYDVFPGHTGEEIHLELIGRDPEDAHAHVLYAGWLVRQGREDDAEAHLETTRGEGVDAPVLGEALVRLALRRGDLASARAAWVEMVEEDEDARATKIAEARIAMAEQRHQDAIDLLAPLAIETPHYETQRLLAFAYQRRGDLPAAQRAAALALKLAPPPKTGALRLVAGIDLDIGNWRGAIRAYERLRESGQELSAPERADLALALYRDERSEEGRALLEELSQTKPLSPRAAMVFWELEGESNPERAYRLLERAHGTAPMHQALVALLTDIDLAAEQPDVSRARLTRLVENRMASPFVLLLRSEALAALGAYPEAEADVLRALEANPSLPGAIDLLHSLYAAQGKLEEARHSFEQADQAGVLHAGARQLLARLYREDGETARALETLERVVSEAPELWTARADLAYMLATDEDELGRASELANGALGDSAGDSYARDVAGWIDLRAGRAEAALAQFDAAIRSEGARVPPTVLYHRGLALRALSREDDAADAFERALAAGEFPEAEDARQQLEATRHPEAPSTGSAS